MERTPHAPGTLILVRWSVYYYRWVGAALFAASLYDRQARVHEELVRFPLTSSRTGLHLREDHVTPLSCSEDVLWRYAEKDMLALG